MNKPVSICTDLDRTLILNGPQPESPQAKSRQATHSRLESRQIHANLIINAILSAGAISRYERHYGAGVSEGVAHYFPHTKAWLASVYVKKVKQQSVKQ